LSLQKINGASLSYLGAALMLSCHSVADANFVSHAMLQMHVHKKKIRAAGERSPSPPTLSKRETETERVSQGKKIQPVSSPHVQEPKPVLRS